MTRGELIEGRLTHSVIGAFYEAYNELRYGFREHVYSLALEHELLARGHGVSRELAVPIFYKGEELTSERLDFIVDERLVVELKSTAILPRGAERQLLSYLRASRLEVGLLLHFGPVARFYRLACSNSTKVLPSDKPVRTSSHRN
jgi:GxxExxY protein